MNIRREDAGDALRVVRRHRGERKTVGKECLHNIADTRAAAEAYLHSREVLPYNTAVIIERDKCVIRNDTVIERVAGTEEA